MLGRPSQMSMHGLKGVLRNSWNMNNKLNHNGIDIPQKPWQNAVWLNWFISQNINIKWNKPISEQEVRSLCRRSVPLWFEAFFMFHENPIFQLLYPSMQCLAGSFASVGVCDCFMSCVDRSWTISFSNHPRASAGRLPSRGARDEGTCEYITGTNGYHHVAVVLALLC